MLLHDHEIVGLALVGRAGELAPAPLRHRLGVPGAHDRRPVTVLAVRTEPVLVVLEAERVADLVGHSLGHRLGRVTDALLEDEAGAVVRTAPGRLVVVDVVERADVRESTAPARLVHEGGVGDHDPHAELLVVLAGAHETLLVGSSVVTSMANGAKSSLTRCQISWIASSSPGPNVPGLVDVVR
ncbi:MAG: hypothetical protein R2705_17155 [Ilumatobacteraceae bacterium]